MIESEKGESCLLNMASSKAAHSLLGTKGLGSNSSQFEQGDSLSSSNLITVKMNPPDTAKVCKKIPDKCQQNTSPTKIAVAPSITIKKVLSEPLNGKPVATLVKAKKVNCSEIKDSTSNAECTAIADSGNKKGQINDQDCDSLPNTKTGSNSVKSNCKQQDRENDEKHKWPSEDNAVPPQNSVLKTLSKLVQNSKSVKLKLSPSSLSSKEELDDVSIDMTEEEEDALLGKHEMSDTETDPEANVPASADNQDAEVDDEGSDKLDTAEWKVLDETEASTCSSEVSPRVSVGGMSPASTAISPCRSTPRQVQSEPEKRKSDQKDFTSLCNNISSTITKLGILRLPQSVVKSDNLKLSDQLKSTDSVTENSETNSLASPQDSNIKKANSQTENKFVKENLFDKYAKEKLVTTKISDIAFVPEDDSDEEKDLKIESSLWNFADGATAESNQPNKSLNISFFDNTATEDGMQLAVDKVVQKILTEISDDSDTNEVSNASSVKLSKNSASKVGEQSKEGSLEASMCPSKQTPEAVEATKVGKNESPSPQCAETPKSDNSGNPKTGGAEVPKPGGVEVPQAEGAQVPDAGVAEVPEAEVVDTLMAEEAEVPKAEGAELPKAEGAEVPMDEDAAIPEENDAAIPKADGAEIPNCEGAEVPDVESAEIPDTKSSDVAKANGLEVPPAEDVEAAKSEGDEASVSESTAKTQAEAECDDSKIESSDATTAEVPEVDATDVSKIDNSEVPSKSADTIASEAKMDDVPKSEEAKVPDLDSVRELKASKCDPNEENVVLKKQVKTEDEKPDSDDAIKSVINKQLDSEKVSNEIGASSKRPMVSPEKDTVSEKKFKADAKACRTSADSVKGEDESSHYLSPVHEINSAVQIAKDKTEFEVKRKRLTDGDDKPIDILTVKKVKLDSDSVREEVKLGLTLSQHKVEHKTEPVASDASKDTKCKGPTKMTKRELDDYIAKKIDLFVTPDEKSDIGVLKLKCEYLEKSVDKWKKKASTMQKQITEMHIALQRAMYARKNAVPVKTQVPTRSVGLQVQSNSLHPLPDQQLPRHITGPPAGATVKRIPISSAGQGVMMNKTTTTSGNMTIISSVKPTTATPTLQSMIAKPPLVSTTIAARPLFGHSTTTVTGVQIPTMASNVSRPNTATLTIAPRPSPVYTNAKPTTTCVSILQPRITNSQPMTVVTTMQAATVPTSSFPKVASVIPPSSTTVRAMLDSRRMQTSMNPTGPPVPMRLVPNQAAVKQAGPPVRPPAPACQPGQAVASGPATPATVKIIDLTADEDEGNNLQTAQVQAIIPNVVSAASSAATSLAQISTMTTQRPVTLIPASQAASMAGGQLFINTTPATGTVAVSTASPIAVRMATPIRTQAPPSTLMTQQGQRVTYLVPSSMVRPPQQLYVPQTGPQSRPVQQVPPQMTQQNILKPPIQTILFQRGTTLYPVAQAPIQNSPASQSVMRPTQPAILRTSQGATVTATQVPTQVQVSSPRPPAPAVQIIQKQPVQRFNTPTNPSSTQNTSDQVPGTPVLVNKVIHKHPAPLPPCAVDLDSSPGLKTPPPKPALKISRVNNGIVLSWNMSLTPKHAEIARYQLYAYQESNAPPSTTLWKKVGDVKALPLPMACTLTQFMEGHKYHFAVRAVDVHDRIGTFSDPGSIVLNSPNTPPSSSPAGIRL